jgi:hypothetical protein
MSRLHVRTAAMATGTNVYIMKLPDAMIPFPPHMASAVRRCRLGATTSYGLYCTPYLYLLNPRLAHAGNYVKTWEHIHTILCGFLLFDHQRIHLRDATRDIISTGSYDI